MTSITQHAVEIKQQFGNALNGRIDAGQALALTGRVTQVSETEFQVRSATEAGKFYTVKWAGAWSCECKDFTGDGYHPAPIIAAFGGTQAVCKHVVAAALCYFSGEYPTAPVADLVIVTKKTPFVSESNGRILWIKRAGCEKIEPKTEKHLSDNDIAAKLAKYQLVDTEARAGQVIRRYRLAGGAL